MPPRSQLAVALLLDHGLITNRDLVADHLMVRRAIGRSENYTAVFAHRPGFFLKFPAGDDVSRGRYMATELAFYRRASQDAGFKDTVPAFHGHDSATPALILEHLRGSYARPTKSPRRCPVAASLGEVVAQCHRVAAGDESWAFLEEVTPWALSLARPRPESLRIMSQGQARVVATVQDHAVAFEALDDLRDGWSASTLIHMDLKWANMTVDGRVDDRSKPMVKLFDWELAAWGDPAWDVGSVFHSYLTQAILMVEVDRGTPMDELIAGFEQRLPRIRRDYAVFWGQYAAGVGLDEVNASEFTLRATRYCGARLIQTAYEWSAREKGLSRKATPLLQLGINILEHPEEALERVIGLSGQPS